MTIKTKVHIFPSKAKGIVTAPPSKSISHRLLISAALADNKSLIHNIDLSQDLLATLDCLKVTYKLPENKTTPRVKKTVADRKSVV